MDRPFRTLPMRTEPIDGEALDSWLERFAAAARYRTLTVAAEHSWSLSKSPPFGAASIMPIRLRPAEAAAISAATGQPAAQPFETEAR